MQTHIDSVSDYPTIESDGSFIATQRHTGRAPKISQDGPRPALCGLAFCAERPVDAQVYYPGSNTIDPLSGKTRKKSLDSLSTDIANHRTSHFPPEPGDDRYWPVRAGCLLLLLCQWGEA